MRHEKVLKREDGTQFRIDVRCTIGIYSSDKIIEYRIDVLTKAKGKRKWNYVPMEMNDWDFRALSLEDRRIATSKNFLRFVSKDEIYAAKCEMWELLKPKQ